MTRAVTDAIRNQGIWRKIGDYLERDDVRLLASEHQQRLQNDWEDITKQEELLDDALLIGLVGGTGVGKSTFINALAGEVVSRSGDRRPTTDRVVAYRHVDTELPDEMPTDDLAKPQVLHRHQQLSKIVLLDFPDFDSAERSHTHILQKYLEHLDVLLIVVDDIKYADRRLYELLRSLDHASSNLFVLLNKIDRLRTRYEKETESVVENLLSDLQEKLETNAQIKLSPEQLFPLSAGKVVDARVHGKQIDESLGERFEAVEDLLHSFQEEKHRKRAKEENIDSRKGILVAEISNYALGSENRSILKETTQLISDWQRELDDAIQTIPVEVLIEPERRALRKSRLRRSGPEWGFPFSFLFTLLREMPWAKSADAVLDQNELAARIHQHYRGFFEAERNLHARFKTEFAGSSIADNALDSIRVDSPEQWSTRMAGRVRSGIQQREERVPAWKSRCCHVPALAIVVLAIWSQLNSILESGFFTAIGKAFLALMNPTALLGLLVAVVAAYLVTAIVIWVREVQILDRQISDAEERIRQEVRVHRDETIEALRANVDSLTREFDEIQSLIE